MKTRPRDIGTWWESLIVCMAQEQGLRARRLAEGGSKDEGDVEVYDANGTRWVIECRVREQMNAHAALAQAREKSPSAVLAWLRYVRKPGAKRRTRAGPPIVAMPPEVFLAFLSRRCGCDRLDLPDDWRCPNCGGSHYSGHDC